MSKFEVIQHSFTSTIFEVLQKHFGEYAEDIFQASPILGYLNNKTKAANRGSKARGAFANGVKITVHRVKRFRRRLGIRGKQKRKFKATTNSNRTLPVAPNLLEQKFTASAPNQVWLTDITYIPTDEGWLYLAGHKDLFSGGLVGYAMSERMTRNLISQPLFRGVAAKRPHRGVIHHSDRGS